MLAIPADPIDSFRYEIDIKKPRVNKMHAANTKTAQYDNTLNLGQLYACRILAAMTGDSDIY
jgi:hypothetical protein